MIVYRIETRRKKEKEGKSSPQREHRGRRGNGEKGDFTTEDTESTENEEKIEKRNSKREAGRRDCGAIPPLRTGRGRRCCGRDDRVKKGPTRHKSARKRESGRSARNDGVYFAARMRSFAHKARSG